MSDPRQDVVRDLSTAAMKASPAVGVTIWGWLGQNLPTAVALATLVYILFQIGHLLFSWRRELRGKRAAAGDPSD